MSTAYVENDKNPAASDQHDTNLETSDQHDTNVGTRTHTSRRSEQEDISVRAASRRVSASSTGTQGFVLGFRV